jgi:excisionase family DNA binding protein
MPEEELKANRRIEAVRPGADLAGVRALARTFRRRSIPPYQVTARAAMVEALLRGPCRATDRATADRLMEAPPRHAVWECLSAYLGIVRGLKDGALPQVVLASVGDALRIASRTDDPLGMVDALRGLKATLQQAVADTRAPTRATRVATEEEAATEGQPQGTKARKSKFYTIPESAEWLHLGERTVWRHISNEELHVTYFGRAARIAEDELERFAAVMKRPHRRRRVERQ